MVTPAKGDYASIPITIEAKKVGDAWDPAKDEAAGEQCKSYGAPAIMAVPTRLRIAWQDDNTLQVETDAGMQTRRFQFGQPEATAGIGHLAGRLDRAMGKAARRPGGSSRRAGLSRSSRRICAPDTCARTVCLTVLTPC